MISSIKSGRLANGLLGLALGLVMVLGLAPSVLAQDGPTQDEVNAVARKLFCPVCENTPLDVCPTEACEQWREVIRSKLSEGQSERQILDYFAELYGTSVLAEPPPTEWVAWALPAVIVLAAVGALVYWLRSWLRPAPIAQPNEVEVIGPESDPYVERLEKELAEWV